jgi:hypothetical protein
VPIFPAFRSLSPTQHAGNALRLSSFAFESKRPETGPARDRLQARGHFSFGVCLLQLASGRFAPRGGEQRYQSLGRGGVLLGSDLYPCEFAPGFVRLVNAALSQDPERRPTAALMARLGREWCAAAKSESEPKEYF